jgi:hypothetical protein
MIAAAVASFVVASARAGAAAPNVPSGLSSFRFGNSVTLSWTDNSTDEEGFRVFRSVDDGSFIEIAAVGADAVEYVDTDVVTGVKYAYYVVSHAQGTDSGPSNEVTADYVKVLAPNGGESLTAGGLYDITVESNIAQAASDWLVAVSTDGGLSFPHIVYPSGAPNPFPWKAGYKADQSQPPNINSVLFVTSTEADCVVKVADYLNDDIGGHLTDESDAPFTVTAVPPPSGDGDGGCAPGAGGLACASALLAGLAAAAGRRRRR